MNRPRLWSTWGARSLTLGVVVCVVSSLGVVVDGQAPAPTVPRPAAARRTPVSAPSAAELAPFVSRYCVGCHSDRQKTGGLSLEGADVVDLSTRTEVWEKVVRKLRTGAMPPLGATRPDESVRASVIASLEAGLDRLASARPYPGRPSVHRLNRAEYANAVRDLVAIEITPETFLPPDNPSHGFDNIGEVLDLSPSLLERYSAAAGEIASLAVGHVGDVVATSRVFRAPADHSQDTHVDGLPLGTVGGLAARTTLPVDGEYVIKANLFKTNLGLLRGLEFERTLEFLVDGERVFDITIGGEKQFEEMLQNQTNFADALEAKLQARVRLPAGPHQIAATFAGRPAVVNTRRLQAMTRSTSDTSETLLGPPHVMVLTVSGPFGTTTPGDTPSRRRIFTCTPTGPADEERCAQRILGALAHRAFRGTETPQDLRELLTFYRRGREQGGFDAGIALALQRILAGPKFLVRVEREPASASTRVYRVSDLELASRLSFFLWSSIPDDELLRVASEGRLRSSAVLEQQVRRMLDDPKSQALVSNFAGQWLQLRNLKSAVPDSRRFPNFDDQLRQSFRRETELLFETLIRENRSIVELLTADFTFVNERLAKHYGVPGVYGTEFRRVPVMDDRRRGLIGHGSILTITSHADRTSPVVRGKWVLDTLLGAPPPPPPPNVPPLRDVDNAVRPMSMRQRMEAHRANPVCAACHRTMDPLGFALENFDAVGSWRTSEARVPIDTAGVFIDGSAIDGPVALRAAVLRRPDNFVTTFTEKLLTYALGRGLDARDMPTVRAIVREAARSDYRVPSIVNGIVRSLPFQNRAGITLDAVTTTARN